MTALTWDATGERFHESGVDRGVLGIKDGETVAWNGLISVEDSPSSDLKQFFLDGSKFLQVLAPGDYLGKLRAYTYPDEFDQVNGLANFDGIRFHEQKPKSFNLAYRTRKSNDVDPELGYKLHFLYNLLADPDTEVSRTHTESSVDPTEFSWTLTGTPVKIDQVRPAVHVSIDSTAVDPEILAAIEDILYGTDATDPRFPDMDELAGFFGYVGSLIIIDNGDGTWTAIGALGAYITMISETEFQIDNVDATYLDADTYTVSSTYVGWV